MSDFSEMALSFNEIQQQMIKIQTIDQQVKNSSKDLFKIDNRHSQPAKISSSGKNKVLSFD
jgi:hypothetical protein